MEPNPPSSFYIGREANDRALVVSIVGKFVSQESFKIESTMSQNNSNNDSEQQNQHQPNFIFPVANSDDETGRKESSKAGDSPVEPTEKVYIRNHRLQLLIKYSR